MELDEQPCYFIAILGNRIQPSETYAEVKKRRPLIALGGHLARWGGKNLSRALQGRSPERKGIRNG